MKIQMINHASVLIEAAGVRLLTDPWLYGPAFNEGWDLLSETPFGVDFFQTVTHIWFSHEHPDHFAPRVLKDIPKPVREKITVVFQFTHDKKIVRFCKGLGFRILECRDYEWQQLSPGFRAKVGRVGLMDSWLYLEADGVNVLNLNDCVVDGVGKSSIIARKVGRVDVLFTQYSYANWIGNEDESDLRVASAAEKLERVKDQIRVLKPKFTVPMASQVWFSHQENRYLNADVNTIMRAHEAIKEGTSSLPVVLYPGTEWIVGSPTKNETELARYSADYGSIPGRAGRTAETAAVEALKAASLKYLDRVARNNARWLMRLMALPPLNCFKPVRIKLWDHPGVWEFGVFSGFREAVDGAVDIEMHSQSLKFIFDFDWGFDTLMVGGRFRIRSNLKKVIRQWFVGSLNNSGRGVNLEYPFVSFLLRKVYWTWVSRFIKPPSNWPEGA